MVEEPSVIWERSFFSADREKRLRILCGDICNVPEPYDVVVCSAYKGDYVPSRGTLIGGLERSCGIFVAELAQAPVLDMRSMGCWLSKELENKFKRVACVELIDWQSRFSVDYRNGVMLKSAFSTLKYILEQADINGIPVRSVILPVLGSGQQGVEMCYIAGPLLHQCISALKTIDGVECITFCEFDEAKAYELVKCLEKMLDPDVVASPEVFISYSHIQLDTASEMRDFLQRKDIPCWMAPYSIPAGSSYLTEIPSALGNTPVVVLLLTPEAERSRWVPKELGMALGSGHKIMPFQPWEYQIGAPFQFLLEGEQIMCAWRYPKDIQLPIFARQIQEQLRSIRSK